MSSSTFQSVYSNNNKNNNNNNILQSITTKAKFYSCSRHRRQDTEKCEMLTGYYLDPKETCYTSDNELLGNLPELDRRGRSILCTSPGKLTSVFGVGSELNDMTMMFVDKAKG